MTSHQPDFENFLRLLRCDPKAKPALFELFLNQPLYCKLAGREPESDTVLDQLRLLVDAFTNAGYDYTTTHACDMNFPTSEQRHAQTISLNAGIMITDRESFDRYPWPDPKAYDYSRLEQIKPYLPENMKLSVMGPGGVLENVIALVGYENLCYLLFEDSQLVQDLFDAVGSRLVTYYEIALEYDTVGMIVSNDDWGFNTQTFLSEEDMRRYVFPWHKKIVAAAHRKGKPAVLHSCGYMGGVMEDIIEDMKFDGKHSYEDNILCVEDSYRRWGGRIAILGGIDVDFIIRSQPEEIRQRCKAMLRLAEGKGGYALGTGNSVPEYIPDEHYLAMIHSLIN